MPNHFHFCLSASNSVWMDIGAKDRQKTCFFHCRKDIFFLSCWSNQKNAILKKQVIRYKWWAHVKACDLPSDGLVKNTCQSGCLAYSGQCIKILLGNFVCITAEWRHAAALLVEQFQMNGASHLKTVVAPTHSFLEFQTLALSGQYAVA